MAKRKAPGGASGDGDGGKSGSGSGSAPAPRRRKIVIRSRAAPRTEAERDEEGDRLMQEAEAARREQEGGEDPQAGYTPAQLKRYEFFRRSTFHTSKVKRMVQDASQCKCNDRTSVVVKGIAKVLVGEVVEAALDVQRRWGDEGPLYPKHVREAYRVLTQTGALPKPALHREPLLKR